MYSVFNPFPVTERLLCYFVAHLAEEGLAYQTVKTYLAAVRDTHVSLGFPDLRSSDNLPRLTKIQAGIRRVQALKNQPKRVRLPITPAILERLRVHWSSDRDGGLFWAVASLCFFGFFRLGELLAPSADKLLYLSWGDVSFDRAPHPSIMKVHLKTSKCDQFGKGVNIFIGRSKDSICPVEACLAYIAVRGSDPGYFFRDREGKWLLKPRFVSEMRKALAAIGLHQETYAGHSFRIGAATTAAAAGLEDSTIQLLGRWNSAAFLAYIRTPGIQLAAHTARLAKRQ